MKTVLSLKTMVPVGFSLRKEREGGQGGGQGGGAGKEGGHDDTMTCWHVGMLACWHADMMTC